MSASELPFTSFSFAEKRLLYHGLLSLVSSNSGHGFCNNQQGHPAYVAGQDGSFDFTQLGDSPEHNILFKMMHSLSCDLHVAELDNKSEISQYVYCWADFCRLAYTAYKNSTKYE
jgi:hypothetical protein